MCLLASQLFKESSSWIVQIQMLEHEKNRWRNNKVLKFFGFLAQMLVLVRDHRYNSQYVTLKVQLCVKMIFSVLHFHCIYCQCFPFVVWWFGKRSGVNTQISQQISEGKQLLVTQVAKCNTFIFILDYINL